MLRFRTTRENEKDEEDGMQQRKEEKLAYPYEEICKRKRKQKKCNNGFLRHQKSWFWIFLCLLIFYLIYKELEWTLVDRNANTLDFVVAGFLKTGTSSLLTLFDDHPETSVVGFVEQRKSLLPGILGEIGLTQDVRDIYQAASTQTKIRALAARNNRQQGILAGLKNPLLMYSPSATRRILAHSPNVKFIVGIRHPLMWVECFYNYLVVDLAMRNLSFVLPSFDMGKDVLLYMVRYEQHLEQMVEVLMESTKRGDHPKLLLYTYDQLSQGNGKVERSLDEFLGVSQPFQDIPHRNTNTRSKEGNYIDICDDKWAAFRAKAQQQFEQTVQTIEQSILQESVVTVPDRIQFVHILHKWVTEDPCLNRLPFKERMALVKNNY